MPRPLVTDLGIERGVSAKGMLASKSHNAKSVLAMHLFEILFFRELVQKLV
ncbi:4697_t:CDS:1, partial [Funneliformis caledonium]